MIKYLFFIVFLTLSLAVYPQSNSSIELAADYFQKKDFDKAAVLYEQLYEQTNANVYFTFLFNCYTALQKFNDAEKLVKKQIKRSNNDLKYQVTLSKLYTIQGNNEKAKQTINKAIEKLQPDQQQITSFANALEEEHDFESAIAVYKKGQKLLDKSYNFHMELANIYQITKNYSKMADEFISLLEESPDYLIPIQNQLQILIQNDIENTLGNIVKNALLTKIQTNNKTIQLSELLIWLFIQEKDFTQALLQAKAIDRRTGTESNNIMEIGEVALSNNEFDPAISAFQYLKEKGIQTNFYYQAFCNYLLSLNRKILFNPLHTKTEEIELEDQLVQGIQSYGINHLSVQLLIDLAHLQTHFLNKSGNAITQLETAIQSNNLNLDDKSDLRMELGDTYLYSNNIWDANLVYAKVEMDKQGAPISNNAKFKRAKIAYYVGDFKWAVALLDILKAATSKETSNDAFELSLLISDNTQDDSLFNAMKLFSNADYLLVRDCDSLAIITFDSIPKLYPGNQLEDDILYRKANIYENKNMIDSAISIYQQIANRFSYEIYADDAIYKLGVLYESKKKDSTKALEYYKRIVSEFSNSIYVFDARLRYRKLKGEIAQ